MKKSLLILLALASCIYAEALKIASGAGYKKPLMDIVKEYEKSEAKIEPFFGNMRQVTTQATQTNIALIVGDKNFLSKKSNLEFNDYIHLGKEKLVIAYAKNKNLSSYEELQNLEKIAMPQPQKAIYGTAGFEFLQKSKLYEKVENKLHIVATVPQAMTYVITGEVDAAIVNLTAVLANKDKISGYIEVDSTLYNPIDIVAGVLPPCNNKECEDFIHFLHSPEATNIFEKYGL